MTPPFTLLQSEWWGEVKAHQGWRRLPASSAFESAGTVGADLAAAEPLILERSVGPFRLAYVPHGFATSAPSKPGPEPEPEPEPLDHVVATFRAAATAVAPGPHVVRWDVPWSVDRFDAVSARAAGLLPSSTRVQPPDTVVVNLSGDEDALLSAMKRKTRYNVRLAAKRGVTVRAFSDGAALDELPAWYDLYRETARRDRITIHPFAYYRTVVETAVRMRAAGRAAPRVSVYLAFHEEDLLSGIIVASWQGMSTYLYGASSNQKRNLMASYLVQWEAMRAAHAAGDSWYDLFGIPPSDDPDHPMHGLYRFKTGFGGEVIHRPGCWDLPSRSLGAGLFRRAERLRMWYYHDLRKRWGRGS